MTDVPRDASKLNKTTHLKQQMKARNIGWHEVKMAIETGTTEEDADPDNIRYRLDFPGVDLLVSVDPDKMNINTAFYDDEQGARGGRL